MNNEYDDNPVYQENIWIGEVDVLNERTKRAQSHWEKQQYLLADSRLICRA